MGISQERSAMRKSFSLQPLLEPLAALQRLMEKSECRWMIIGGVAASLLGKPRFTADVDVVTLVEDKNIAGLLKLAKHFGFRPRIKDAVTFARENRVLLLEHKKSGINIDISLGLLPFEEKALQRRRPYKAGNITFYLPTKEDLIIFKAVAHRPQDMMDIREIVNLHPGLDKRYIKEMVRQFARALEMPEIWTDIKSLLSLK